MSDKPYKDDAYWQQLLSAKDYHICREKGTESAFSGCYWDAKTPGVYHCKCCGEALFGSTAKYDSGSGWPSFFEPLQASAIEELRDMSHGMVRTEVMCKHCGSHLGHLFADGPEPTGRRYCINSASLSLKQK